MNNKLELNVKEENELNDLDLAMRDPGFAAEWNRVSAEIAEWQKEPCPPSEGEEDMVPYAIDFNRDILVPLKSVKQNIKVIKLKDVENPIVGIYQGKEAGKFSSIYSILTDAGIVKIFGCTDLDSKMCQVLVGKRVYIDRAEMTTTASGRVYVKADVRTTQ